MGIDVSRIGDHPIACKIFTSIRVMAEENSDDNVFDFLFFANRFLVPSSRGNNEFCQCKNLRT